jgi:hypothetical protein
MYMVEYYYYIYGRVLLLYIWWSTFIPSRCIFLWRGHLCFLVQIMRSKSGSGSVIRTVLGDFYNKVLFF